MIRLGNQIRLTSAEIARFTWLTEIPPVNITSLQDLDRYVRTCKERYAGQGSDTILLHRLIDRAAACCHNRHGNLFDRRLCPTVRLWRLLTHVGRVCLILNGAGLFYLLVLLA